MYGTTHSSTDATASQELATTLMDANHDFPHCVVNPELVLKPVHITATASRTGS